MGGRPKAICIYLPNKSRQRNGNERKRKITTVWLSKSMLTEIQSDWYMKCLAELRVYVLNELFEKRTQNPERKSVQKIQNEGKNNGMQFHARTSTTLLGGRGYPSSL